MKSVVETHAGVRTHAGAAFDQPTLVRFGPRGARHVQRPQHTRGTEGEVDPAELELRDVAGEEAVVTVGGGAVHDGPHHAVAYFLPPVDVRIHARERFRCRTAAQD